MVPVGAVIHFLGNSACHRFIHNPEGSPGLSYRKNILCKEWAYIAGVRTPEWGSREGKGNGKTLIYRDKNMHKQGNVVVVAVDSRCRQLCCSYVHVHVCTYYYF